MGIKARNVAKESTNSSIPVMFRIVTTNNAADFDVKVPFAFTITNITIRKGAAGTGSTTDDVAILTGTADGTFTAVDVSAATNLNTVTAGSMVTCGVVEAERNVEAGGSIRVTTTKTSFCDAEVIVTGFRT